MRAVRIKVIGLEKHLQPCKINVVEINDRENFVLPNFCLQNV